MTNPTLALIPSAYKASKVYSILPNNGDGDFSFVRNSSGTRVNSNGLIETVGVNVPRLDYSDGGCPSLLLEPQRTNRILYSEDFTDSSWSKVRSTTALSSELAPNGGFATKAIPSTDNNTHRVDNVITLIDGDLYTYSIYAKKGEYSAISLQIGSGSIGGNYSEFDLINGVSNDVGSCISKITDFANGWFKCSISMESGVTDRLVLGINNVYQNQSFQGDGTSGIYIYGAQIEQGSYPTSYIPTNGSIATRIVETCNNAGNASTFNDSEGVLFFEATALVNGGSNRTITISDGTSANRIYVNLSSTPNNWSCVITVNSVSQGNLLANNIPHNQYNKVALKYKENDFALWINGVERSFDLVGSTFPSDTLNQIDFDFSNGSLPFFGKCKDLRVYDTALTDQELQELTTL